MAYATLLFVLAFACLLPDLRNPLIIYDEGLIALGAERVRMGEVPYRDFWTMYGPGQLFALAGLFKLFGASVLVERAFDLLVRSFLALSLYFLGARLGSRGPALLAWATVVLWRHLPNLLTSLRHRLTNAGLQGLNAVIQGVKKTARGFRNAEHFKTAIYFRCGGLDLYPHESRLSPYNEVVLK